jgi:hypothetical protein
VNNINKQFVNLSVLAIALAAIVSCASKPAIDPAMLEKYPQCYHANIKLSKKCIEKNDAGEKTTATELENTAYPGQYR